MVVYIVYAYNLTPAYVKDIGDSCCMLHALCRIMSKMSKI